MRPYQIVMLLSLLLSFPALLPIACPVAAAAISRELPRQMLEISFDLESRQLQGISHITLPPGVGATIDLVGLEIDSISLDGIPTTLAADSDQLPLAAGNTPRQLIIHYQLTLRGDAPNTGNRIDPNRIELLQGWYPAIDQACLFSLTTVLPPQFAVISEANQITITPMEIDPATSQSQFRFDHPLDRLHLVAVRHTPIERQIDDITLVALLPDEQQTLIDRLLDQTAALLRQYSERFGPYPYQRLVLLDSQRHDIAGFPTAILLPQTAGTTDSAAHDALAFIVAQSWFGHGVRPRPDEGDWSAGLAEFLADQTMANNGNNAAAVGIARRHARMIRFQSMVSDGNSMPLAKYRGNDLLPHPDPIARVVGHDKGAMVFHMLHDLVGDAAFEQGLQDLYQQLLHGTASWADLQSRFTEAGSKDLGPFFGQWLNRDDIPHLDDTRASLRQQAGQTWLSFTLRQNNQPPFQLTVPHRLDLTPEPLDLNVALTEPSNAVDLSLLSSPTQLVLDPEYRLLRHLAASEMPPVWPRFVDATDKVCVVSDDKAAEQLQPLINHLVDMGCRIVADDAMTDKDMAEASVVFLDASGNFSRSLFARVDHPATGLTLDVRHNPFNNQQVAVLVSASSRDDAAAGLPVLQAQESFSFLHIDQNRVQQKTTAETEPGQPTLLDRLPRGVATTKAKSFEDIINELLAKRVIYVGEGHTTYADHRLQLRIIRALHERGPNLAIGMEMFTKDTQPVLNQYISGEIDEPTFLKKSHYFEQWRFDYRLYKEIIDYARLHRIPLLGLNIDKEVVSAVFMQGGTTELIDAQRQQLPLERDLDMAGYQEKLAAVFQRHTPPSGHDRQFAGFVQAQAIWDETMAETAADYLIAHPENRMVVIAGRGHVAGDSAIPPRLHRRLAVDQAVVVNVDNASIDASQADYVMFSPAESLPPQALIGVMLDERDGQVIITGLSRHGQAKAAGIKAQDVILALDGQPVEKIEDVKIAIFYKRSGDSVRVRVRRTRALLGDQELEIDVALRVPKRPEHSPH